MKIIEANWEKRNLNVNAIEISVENELDFENIKHLYLEKYQYVVIKLPVKLSMLIFKLQEIQYKFVELLNYCNFDSEVPELPSIEKRFLNHLKYEILENKDLEIVYKYIDEMMFNTDRISLDPVFGIQKAANRYKGFLTDLLSKDIKLFGIYFKNEISGFFTIRKESNSIYVSDLAGIFPEYKNKGLGIFLNYFEILVTKVFGGKTLKTVYSSNNFGAANIHQNLGFKIYKQEYIFVKHNK